MIFIIAFIKNKKAGEIEVLGVDVAATERDEESAQDTADERANDGTAA